MDLTEDLSSDTSDEDYKPSGEESDDAAVSGGEEKGDETQNGSAETNSKVKHKKIKKKTKRKRGGLFEDTNAAVKEEFEAETEEIKRQKTEIEEKEKADSLWADFLKDVEPPKPKSSVTKTTSETETIAKSSGATSMTGRKVSVSESSGKQKVTITKVFDFAGEDIRITEEVDADSKAAKDSLKETQESDKKQQSTSTSKFQVKSSQGGSGLASLMGKISGKKQKMGVLDKSRLDWETFKEKEGIGEELQTYNRGKEGYVEKQEFLSRADYRQFEIERDLRNQQRKKKFF